MRIDKYIKLTRIIKRREVAKVLLQEGNILVNNKLVKPSYVVKVGDIISFQLGNKKIVVKVKNIFESANKKNANELFDEINY